MSVAARTRGCGLPDPGAPVAGRGLMLHDAGRIEYSPDEAEILFIAGHHFDIPGGPDVGELFCAELA
jgi:hypothetical protein